MLKNVFILILAISFLFSCSTKKEQVDLIIHNAVIYSVDSSFNIYEAMAIKDGKVVELNSNNEILNKFDSPIKNNAVGKSVFPGFIDAHCHFLGYGLGLQQVNLVATKSFTEVIKRVVDFTKNKPADKTEMPISSGKKDWIVGRGWDQNDWSDKKYPNNKLLDSLFPNTPVMLTRIDGHAALVNSEAFRRANVTTKTKAVNGGEIELVNGNLTGILIDNAVDLVKNFIPKNNTENILTALLNAQNNCLAMGLTTVDDAGLMKSEIDVIDEAQKSGKLKMRVYAMLSDSAPNYEHYLKSGPYKTERLNVRSFKFYADGALGSRGACLLHDYEDKKNWKGFLLSEQKHFLKYVKILYEKEFQVNTHCIGDSSVRLILNVYSSCPEMLVDIDAKGLKEISKKRRWRIEHAQVTTKEDMELFKLLSVIPSVQPTHATSDMYWAKDRLGEKRIKYAYAYKDLLTVCGLVALGTDFPVEDISPFKTFFAAVARQDSKGFPKDGFQKENALSREETLKGMTIWAAYSNFEENEKGSLEKGKFADFIILDTDIMKSKIEDVLKTKVLSTYINGERVFDLK